MCAKRNPARAWGAMGGAWWRPSTRRCDATGRRGWRRCAPCCRTGTTQSHRCVRGWGRGGRSAHIDQGIRFLYVCIISYFLNPAFTQQNWVCEISQCRPPLLLVIQYFLTYLSQPSVCGRAFAIFALFRLFYSTTIFVAHILKCFGLNLYFFNLTLYFFL